jgi:phosphoserine phosphatase RsbU/P
MLSTPKHLACAETSASNTDEASLYELRGLTAWVNAVQFGAGHAGGDVHYVSLCPECNVARIALADVSGHGEAVAVLGDTLRQLMQRYLTELSQVGLMKDLNVAVREGLDGVHYATMVAAGWHSRRGLLVTTNAGHPPPLWYQATQQEWGWLETSRAMERARPAGVPLGLLQEIAYDRKVIKPMIGDLIVAYSDGVSEATDPGGNELGRDGLLRIARGLDVRSPEAFGIQLTSALHAFRGGTEPLDDQTIIVLRREPARPSERTVAQEYL